MSYLMFCFPISCEFLVIFYTTCKLNYFIELISILINTLYSMNYMGKRKKYSLNEK